MKCAVEFCDEDAGDFDFCPECYREFNASPEGVRCALLVAQFRFGPAHTLKADWVRRISAERRNGGGR